jgi:hypothetical protein
MNTRSRILRCFFSLFLAGSLFARPQAASPQEAIVIAQRSFVNKSFGLAWIPTDGVIADATFIALSAKKPSSLARSLAKKVGHASSAEVVVAVAGPNSSKAKRVALDAVKIAGPKLPKLVLLFIGDEADVSEVKAMVEKVGGTFVSAAQQ